jgi:hypothetical protein
MRMRWPYLICTAVAAAVALGACQTDGGGGVGTSPDVAPSTVATTGDAGAPPPSAPATGSAASPTAAARGLPDVCTLLSRAEVTQLAGGKPMLSVDPDGLTPAATVRYCQWQLSGARLGIQLSPTTRATFGQDHSGSEPVANLGDEAHFYSNHLFVRKATVQIDVFASTAEGVANDKRLTKAAAAMVVARL